MVSVLLVHVLVKITEHSGPVSGFLKSRVLLLECHWNRLQLLPYRHRKKYPFFGKTDIFHSWFYIGQCRKSRNLSVFFYFYPFKKKTYPFLFFGNRFPTLTWRRNLLRLCPPYLPNPKKRIKQGKNGHNSEEKIVGQRAPLLNQI